MEVSTSAKYAEKDAFSEKVVFIRRNTWTQCPRTTNELQFVLGIIFYAHLKTRDMLIWAIRQNGFQCSNNVKKANRKTYYSI